MKVMAYPNSPKLHRWHSYLGYRVRDSLNKPLGELTNINDSEHGQVWGEINGEFEVNLTGAEVIIVLMSTDVEEAGTSYIRLSSVA